MSEITISAAVAKYRISAPMLWGRSLRDDLDDPLMVDKTSEGEPKLLDDWRLRRLAGQGEMSP